MTNGIESIDPFNLTTNLDVLATRVCSTFDVQSPGEAPYSSCLVQIYPAQGIGQVINLGEGKLVIGREDSCGLTLYDDAVSRRHASLERVGEDYVVSDLGSTNGTFVDDERVTTRTLVDGDRLRIGHQIFKFLSADRIEAHYYETVYKIMMTDGLTQVYNKRFLIDALEREVLRTRRSGRPLAVIMLDLDNFKDVNDTHGHLAGDVVLQELCRRVRSVLRGDEVLARYGGEEFVVVLADASITEARQVGERVREAVAASPIQTEQGAIFVTLSVGLASTDGHLSADELLATADDNLYTAKHAGRNRVVG